MKRYPYSLAVIGLSLTLVSCGASSLGEKASERPNVPTVGRDLGPNQTEVEWEQKIRTRFGGAERPAWYAFFRGVDAADGASDISLVTDLESSSAPFDLAREMCEAVLAMGSLGGVGVMDSEMNDMWDCAQVFSRRA